MTDNIDQTLGLIEGVNSMADTMDAMKRALEERGWSTPMSEQVGAALGSALFSMFPPPQRPSKPSGGRNG